MSSSRGGSVDGAGLWKKIWHVTLPQLRTVLLVTMILQLIGTAQVFLEPYLFTRRRTRDATLTVMLLIYNYAFGNSLGPALRRGGGAQPDAGRVPHRVLTDLSARHARLEQRMTALSRGVGASSLPRARRLRKALVLAADWNAGASSGVWGRPGPAARGAGDRRARPDPVARQVCDHADPGHADQSDGVFPHGTDLSNISNAWTQVDIGLYLKNTIVSRSARGSVRSSSRRPAPTRSPYCDRSAGNVITAALLTTLFVPSVVLLVPLYIEIVHPPLIGGRYVNSYWAIWLPAGASAFNVVLMKRFFDNLPREIFEAARIDGCGPVRLFVSIVLPMSKPILGVVSLFAVLASWKDFLWPLLVLSNPSEQPISVRLPTIQGGPTSACSWRRC